MIGEARTVTGTVTAIKSDGTRVTLRPGTTVDQGDVIETGAGSAVGLVFLDKTLFSLGANARMTLDDLVYNGTGTDQSSFSVLSGAFSFVSGEIARTPEAMRVRTPVATIGIRGTMVAGDGSLIVLLNQEGHVGSILLRTPQGDFILDQENETYVAGSGAPSFLTPDQIDNLFSGILRIIPLIRGNLDNPDTNFAQLTDIQPQSGGSSFSGGSGLQFRLFTQGGLQGLEFTGPLQGLVDFFTQNFPPPTSQFGEPPEFIPEGNTGPTAGNDDGGTGTEAGGVDNTTPGSPTASGSVGDNVSDPDGDTLTFSADGGGTYGGLVLDSATGNWTYTLSDTDTDTQALNGGETALETFTYTVTDSTGATASATIDITVTGQNDAPDAGSESGGVLEAGGTANNVPGTPTVSGTLADNATDVDNGGALTDDLDFTVAGGGVYGSLALDGASGAWTYTLDNGDTDTQALNQGETAAETFTYTVTDESGASGSATITITVTGANDAPTATDTADGVVTEAGSGGDLPNGPVEAIVPPGQSLSGTLADNVADIDNLGATTDDLDFGLAGSGLGIYGALALDPETGAWTYTLDDTDSDTDALNQGETVTDTFTYTVTDEHSATASATLTVTIVGTNDAPVARAETGGVTEDGTINGESVGSPQASGTLADNVTDVDNAGAATDDLDFALDGSGIGSYGSLQLDPETGAWTYTLDDDSDATNALNEGETAVETFTYTVTDEHNATATATLSVTITGANDAPEATGAGDTVIEHGTINGEAVGQPEATGTLADSVTDADIPGITDNLDFTLNGSGAGTYGSLELDSDSGQWTYTLADGDSDTNALNEGETAPDTFIYTVTDEHGATATATLTVTIIGANDAPTATDDFAGTVTEDAGSDEPNAPAGAGQSLSGTLADNVADVDNAGATTDDLAFALDGSGQGTYGSLSLDPATGDWTYTLDDGDEDTDALNAGETAPDTFIYTVTDESGATATAALTVTIVGSNDAPTAGDGFAGSVTESGGNADEPNGPFESIVPQGPSLSGTLADNVADVDNGGATTDDLDFALDGSGGGTYGSLALDPETGDWTYTLNDGDSDTDALNDGETVTETFTYTVSDESSATASATLTITIVGANDAPTADDDQGGVVEQGFINGAAVGTPTVTGTLADNVADVDNAGALTDDLDFALAGSGAGTYGSLSLDAQSGQWTYTLDNTDSDTNALNEGETATETFAYTVTDESGATASATVTVTVAGANDTPTAQAETGIVSEAGGVANGSPGTPSVSGTLADNVSDVDDAGALTDDLDFTASAGGTYGSLTLDGDTGAWTYTLNNSDSDTQALKTGQSALETFTYTVTDEHGATATSTIVITVAGADDLSAAPTNTLPSGWGVPESALWNIPGLTVADADSAQLTVSLSAAGGDALSLGTAVGLTLIDGDGSDGTLKFKGSLADINSALTSLRYLAANVESDQTHTLTIVSDDGTSSDTDTVSVTVYADPNDVDTLAGQNVTVDNDTLVTDPVNANNDNDTLGFPDTVGSADDHDNETVAAFSDGDGSGNLLRGTTGSDTTGSGINGNGGNDTIYGAAGSDRLTGDAGNDLIYGGSGNDTMVGDDSTSGADTMYGGTGNDSISAGGGDDSVFGGDGNDRVAAGAGADTVYGGAGSDSIRGDAGSDLMFGGEGDDSIYGSDSTGNDTSADTLYGGAGSDYIRGNDSAGDLIYGGSGNDAINAGSDGGNSDTVYGGSGVDSILAGDGNDLAYGGDGNDVYIGGGTGSDTLYGDGGDDSLDGDTGDDLVYGGDGNDSVFGSSGRDSVYGGAGNDVLSGGSDNDLLAGDAGNDKIAGDDGNDLLYGGAGNDSVVGDDGNDTVYGGSGNDTLRGRNDDDVVNGGSGNDSIDAGSGNDAAYGGSGDDTIDGSGGVDSLYGGTGNDLLRSADPNGGKEFDEDGGGQAPAADALFGGSGNDTLVGDNGDDQLYGGSGDDSLLGDNGDDRLFGGSGNDLLSAGNHEDLLIGGFGRDTMTGGNQDDTFGFLSPLDLGDANNHGDVITDFSPGHDKLLFDIDGANLSGFQMPGFAGVTVVGGSDVAPVALDAGEFFSDLNGDTSSVGSAVRFIFDQNDAGGSKLYYDATGGDASDRVLVATFSNGATLTNTDILVFHTNTITEHG